MPLSLSSTPPTSSPFSLESDTHYLTWRDQKLAATPDYRHANPNDLFISIADTDSLSTAEKEKIALACNQNNMAFYRISDDVPQNNKKPILHFAHQMGLNRLDHNLCADADDLTSITHTNHQGQHNYIPYSTKRLSWHTDGYYNTPDHQIHGMVLHCALPAKSGGESLLLDHEIAYLLLRDENPDYIKALMKPNAMTIPANILDGKVIRDAQSGPVFSINQQGRLHMRYSARKRNIEWQQDDHTLEAVAHLDALWETAAKGESPYVLRYTLQAGEGLICNNVLHCRTAFEDFEEPTKKRLLYRGRYFDRVQS